jgi:uncharacterized protein YjbJ (UPF0337 family)
MAPDCGVQRQPIRPLATARFAERTTEKPGKCPDRAPDAASAGTGPARRLPSHTVSAFSRSSHREKHMSDELKRDGLENQVKGAAKQVEGKTREAVGDLTDNESEQLKGKAKNLEGKAQRKIGEAQDDLG